MAHYGFDYKSDHLDVCDGNRPATLEELNSLEVSEHAFEERQDWEGLLKFCKRHPEGKKEYKHFIIFECVAKDYGTGPFNDHPDGWHRYCNIVLADYEEDLETLRLYASILLERGFKGSFNKLFENSAVLADASIDESQT